MRRTGVGITGPIYEHKGFYIMRDSNSRWWLVYAPSAECLEGNPGWAAHPFKTRHEAIGAVDANATS